MNILVNVFYWELFLGKTDRDLEEKDARFKNCNFDIILQRGSEDHVGHTSEEFKLGQKKLEYFDLCISQSLFKGCLQGDINMYTSCFPVTDAETVCSKSTLEAGMHLISKGI